MTSIRELKLDDLFKFNGLVFDPLTEVYRLSFFVHHIAQWPELAIASITPNDQLSGFIFGKCVMGCKDNTELHGHVCALTVSSNYRRLGMASTLLNSFIHILNLRGAWYLDLYLRCSNIAAYNLYCAMGFILRRVLLEYYPGDPEEDAFDMRKALAIDVDGQSVTYASREPVHLPSDEEYDEDY